MQSKYTAIDVARFWGNVQSTSDPNECWNWSLSKTHDGYGQVSIEGKTLRTHRLAYELTFGTIPEGYYVCHKCDNRLCCNPHHLFLGTCQDNQTDKVRKGRQLKDERNPSCKLTNAEVEEIRLRHSIGDETQTNIAKTMGVSISLVSQILHHKRRS